MFSKIDISKIFKTGYCLELLTSETMKLKITWMY